MTTTFMRDFERDPAKAVRRQLEQLWAQNAREVEQAAKSAEERKYTAAYAERHKPENPNDAA